MAATFACATEIACSNAGVAPEVPVEAADVAWDSRLITDLHAVKGPSRDMKPSITTQTVRTDLADRDDVKVGVWLTPQHTTTERLRRAWRAADALGVDSIWLWDHFYPLTGDPEGTHFEAWSLLAVMAVETRTATIGPLVGNYVLRNPDLLADMARTVDHLSGGRLVLGLGAGWVERDLVEYGYPLLASKDRVDGLVETLDRVQRRFDALNPPPRGPVPLLIGADGPRMLRLVAERASIWNTMARKFAEGNAALVSR